MKTKSSPTPRDSVALVTGAASGIGRATALAFSDAGATVVVSDVDVDGGEATAAVISVRGGEGSFVRADVTQAGEVAALIGTIVERYGRLDSACNNAGVGLGGLVHEMSEADWHRVIGTNLTGVFFCMQHEIRQMLAQGVGSIVNVASIAGLVGLPGAAAYTASKHGVVGLTRTAAVDLAQSGIRVNAVCPGWIDTPMVFGADASPEFRLEVGGRQPVGRLGTPEEVARAVVWLCSDAASFVTGSAMAVDGGYSAR